MKRIAQVILCLVLVVAAACVPVTDGDACKACDSPTSLTTVLDKDVNGDIGINISGSAVRPPNGSAQANRPRPTLNDVISALQNLTTKKPDEAGSLPESTVTDVPITVGGPVQPSFDTSHPGQQTVPDVTNNPLDMANQSIIILNLNDLNGLQSGESSLGQLLTILNGKPGFLFVMTGGQGKFIPLNQLHLLPKNFVPSYAVLLMRGRPNPFPGLQLINGLFQNGNQGNLGFQIPNLVNFASLPVYVVQGYYPIWSILMNLGIYQPDMGNHLPRPDPTPYPGLISPTPYPGISIGKFIPPATTPRPIPRPTNSPVFLPKQPNIDWTGLLTIPNENNDKIFSNKDSHDVFDSELITLLLHVLNEKPGSETEHIITQEKSNPAKLLRIFIELLCQKSGNQQVFIGNKNENNPMKLLQILIKLLRQKNSSTTVIKQNNDYSEERLIQLLMKLIRQKDESQVVISHGNNNNQAKLTQLLIQLLGNRDQFNNVLISSQNNGQSQLLQNLIQLLIASNQEASHILISGNNDANSAQRLYNILLQMISGTPGSSNFGNTIYLNGGSGNSGISSESLMQLVQILLRQKQSYPTIFKNQDTGFQSFIGGGSNNFGSNSKILTMLLGSGGGSTNKSALWSYLLGNFGCMNHNGLTVLCAK